MAAVPANIFSAVRVGRQYSEQGSNMGSDVPSRQNSEPGQGRSPSPSRLYGRSFSESSTSSCSSNEEGTGRSRCASTPTEMLDAKKWGRDCSKSFMESIKKYMAINMPLLGMADVVATMGQNEPTGNFAKGAMIVGPELGMGRN